MEISGEKITFQKFREKYGSSPEKMEKLGQISREERREYFQWESSIENKDIERKKEALNQEKQGLEQDQRALNQSDERISGKKEALNQKQ